MRTDAIDIGTDDIAQDEIMKYGIKFDKDLTIATDPEEIIVGDIW